MYYVEIGFDRLYCINLSENKKKLSATENTVGEFLDCLKEY